jgi:hypothetical protein
MITSLLLQIFQVVGKIVATLIVWKPFKYIYHHQDLLTPYGVLLGSHKYNHGSQIFSISEFFLREK